MMTMLQLSRIVGGMQKKSWVKIIFVDLPEVKYASIFLLWIIDLLDSIVSDDSTLSFCLFIWNSRGIRRMKTAVLLQPYSLITSSSSYFFSPCSILQTHASFNVDSFDQFSRQVRWWLINRMKATWPVTRHSFLDHMKATWTVTDIMIIWKRTWPHYSIIRKRTWPVTRPCGMPFTHPLPQHILDSRLDGHEMISHSYILDNCVEIGFWLLRIVVDPSILSTFVLVPTFLQLLYHRPVTFLTCIYSNLIVIDEIFFVFIIVHFSIISHA